MSTDNETLIEPIKLLLLDKERMAAAICVSSATLDDLRKRGLPSIPVPGCRRVLFNPARVVEWLEGQAVGESETPSLEAAKAEADLVFARRRG
jgi:hypothetical protein